ncbi:MAG: hypothetical protein ACQEWF_22125 [Bacillota bacterium]
MFGLHNLGSLVLGLIAWILPIVNLTRGNKQKNKSWIAISITSLSACGISICFQVLYIYHKVTVEDWGALMDTMYAVAFASLAILIVTIVLNATTLNVYRDRTTK